MTVGATYRTVYTWEPWALYALALVGVIAGVLLIVRSRRASARALRDGAGQGGRGRSVQTGDRADLQRRSRIERIRYVGVAVLALALAAGFFGLQLWDQADTHLRGNLLQRYAPALHAVGDVERVDGGYRVDLEWVEPGMNATAPGETTFAADGVLVTVENRSTPTITEIPPQVLEEHPELRG